MNTIDIDTMARYAPPQDVTDGTVTDAARRGQGPRPMPMGPAVRPHRRRPLVPAYMLGWCWGAMGGYWEKLGEYWEVFEGAFMIFCDSLI